MLLARVVYHSTAFFAKLLLGYVFTFIPNAFSDKTAELLRIEPGVSVYETTCSS